MREMVVKFTCDECGKETALTFNDLTEHVPCVWTNGTVTGTEARVKKVPDGWKQLGGDSGKKDLCSAKCVVAAVGA